MSTEVTETNREENVDVIAGLIKSCRAAQAGFLNAAEHARNSDLGAYFTGRSLERARFAAELERAALQLDGADLSRSAPMAERVHRAWIELKFERGSDGGILSAVAEAERATRDFYRQALCLDFPPEVANLLERQAESISEAYDQVCTLRDMRGRAA